MAGADASEAEALRPAIEAITHEWKELAKLSDPVREELANDLVAAVGFAKVGLTDLLAGKGVKPNAWMLDIFTRDVCDALRKVGAPVLMDPAPKASFAQSFTITLAKAAGFRGMGNLFHQMQRAKKIQKERGPDIPIRWPDVPLR